MSNWIKNWKIKFNKKKKTPSKWNWSNKKRNKWKNRIRSSKIGKLNGSPTQLNNLCWSKDHLKEIWESKRWKNYIKFHKTLRKMESRENNMISTSRGTSCYFFKTTSSWYKKVKNFEIFSDILSVYWLMDDLIFSFLRWNWKRFRKNKNYQE